jgi:hypothetical protein
MPPITALAADPVLDEKEDKFIAASEAASVCDEEMPLTGWKHEAENSLPESFASVPYPEAGAAGWRKMLAFTGMGFVIAVGYMDPGNWATGLAAGSEFGYTLLCAVLLSSVMAMFLQHLALKLGIAAERDLAQACRDAYPHKVNICLWLLAEVAIVACDLAEVIGTAVALNLLSGMPLWAGVLITAADVFIVLLFELKNFRFLEVFIVTLVAVIAGCFIWELAVSRPHWPAVMAGFIPRPEVGARRPARRPACAAGSPGGAQPAQGLVQAARAAGPRARVGSRRRRVAPARPAPPHPPARARVGAPVPKPAPSDPPRPAPRAGGGQPGHAVRGHRHPGRHRHAPQPVPAL